MKLYSRLRCAQKGQKCKFVPRLLVHDCRSDVPTYEEKNGDEAMNTEKRKLRSYSLVFIYLSLIASTGDQLGPDNMRPVRTQTGTSSDRAPYKCFVVST